MTQYMFAIILSRRDFREHDQVLSLYTKEKGKLEALARGVKKITSKNSGSLEPFSLVEIEIIPGKEIDHIGSVQIVELFKNIRGDLEKITAAQLAVALIDTLFTAAEPDSTSFNLIISWLQALDKTPSVNPIILDALVFKLLAQLGFAPQLNECSRCGSTPSPSQMRGQGEASLAFDITAGGILCSDCSLKPAHGNLIMPMTPVVLESLKTILNQNWSVIFSLTLDKKEVPQLHNLVYQFAIFHSGKKLKEWGGLDKYI
ncbi:MAG: DNA repair protein RecO [Candidatus Magasanikbacteria bacterium]|nr:DNA repair protein RecO [Candidatus Magasanikbacteria bacterium]